jgi:hypothetical protein
VLGGVPGLLEMDGELPEIELPRGSDQRGFIKGAKNASAHRMTSAAVAKLILSAVPSSPGASAAGQLPTFGRRVNAAPLCGAHR